MQIKIVVKVGKYPNSDRMVARVRKAIFNDDGKLIKKSVLTSYGEWLEYGPDLQFPENTELEVLVQEIEEEINADHSEINEGR